MKNEALKKIVLTAAAAAVLAVPASAAWSDFTDGSAIVNRAAVDALTARGILSGRTDNSFDPGGLTRRDEMAKMVSLLIDPQAAASGRYDSAAAALYDTAGNWAASYIGHCCSLGVIAGKGGGRFDPAGTVTGTETAVMLLAACGVDTSAFTGPQWAEQVNAAAREVGLFEGFTADPSQPLTRDGAALLLYNGMALLDSPQVIPLWDYGFGPQGIADEGESLLFADSGQSIVVRLAEGDPQLVAGTIGTRGYADGGADESTFQSPWGIAPFLDGWAVSDPENKAVRLVQDGAVQTLNTAAGFTYPTGLAAGEDGCLYVADTHAGKIWRLSETGEAKTVASGLSEPMGLCWRDGVLYIAETGANRVSTLQNGRVTVLAGSGAEGRADGAAQSASFTQPKGVAVGDDGAVYVADTGCSAVRCIRNGVVSTLLAREPGEMIPVSPTGLLVRSGRLYVTDSYTGAIVIIKL